VAGDSDVQVKFGAAIDGLIAGIDESKAQLGSFATAAEAAIGAIGVDKLAEATSRFAELGEQVQRTARITGESTDQIQLFNAAMVLSGGDAEGAATTLSILQKNIGDAISKAGPARSAFEGMGFSLQQLKTTDIVTLLFQIKERLDEAGGSAEQAALKMEYMRTVAGRSGAQFLALKGSLDEIKKIVDETGVSMSPEMVQHATELEEHLHTLGMAFTGLSNSIIDEAAPALSSFTERLQHALEGYTAFINYAKQNGLGSAAGVGLAGLYLQGTFDQKATPGAGATGSWGTPAQQNAVTYPEQFGPQQPQPLPPLDTGTDSDTRDQAAKEAINTQIALSHLAFEQISQDQTSLVAQFKETEADKVQALIAATELMVETEQATLDQEAAGYAQDSLAFQQVQDKKQVLAAQAALEISKLNEQLVEAQKKQYEEELAPWKSLMGDMGGAFDTMVNGILSGQQSWKQALSRSFDDLLIKFMEVMARMTAEYLAFKATQTGASTASGILGFGTTNPFAALSGAGGQAAAETANTTALTALTANMTALEAALGISTTATTTNATITGTSATVIGGLSVPVVANTTATLANTVATWAGAGSSGAGSIFGIGGAATAVGIAAMDVGAWSIPSNGLAFLHAGEMVIPANEAQSFRAGQTNLGGATTGSSGPITFNINAIDTQTGASFLKNNASTIASVIASQSRSFNPNVPGWRS
jgi:hypothetical protein